MKIVIIGAMLLIFHSGFGQQGYPVDEQLTHCLEDSLTTAGMANCQLAAYRAWDQELNKYYQLLMQELKQENRVLLKEAQRQWMRYRDNEFQLINAYYFSERQGTMWIPVAAGERVNIVKARALQLQSYCERLKAMKE